MHRLPFASPGSAEEGKRKEKEKATAEKDEGGGVMVQVWTFN